MQQLLVSRHCDPSETMKTFEMNNKISKNINFGLITNRFIYSKQERGGGGTGEKASGMHIHKASEVVKCKIIIFLSQNLHIKILCSLSPRALQDFQNNLVL